MLQLISSRVGSCLPQTETPPSHAALSPPVTPAALSPPHPRHHGERSVPAMAPGAGGQGWAVITLRPHALNWSRQLRQLPAQPGNSSRWPRTGRILPRGHVVAATGTPTHHDPRLVGRQRVDGQAAPHQVLADARPLGPRRCVPSSPPTSARRGAPGGVSWGNRGPGPWGPTPACVLGSAPSPSEAASAYVTRV